MTDQVAVHVPRNHSERLELLAVRPPAWEYLLFGSWLLAGLERTEDKWRDYILSYSGVPGPELDDQALVRKLSDQFSQAVSITSNLGRVISQEAQEAAFGKPGSPGDPALIEHVANRLIAIYERMLDWQSHLRSLRISTRAQPALAAAQQMMVQPPLAIRNFVSAFVGELEAGLQRRSDGEVEPVVITMEICFQIDPGVVSSFSHELKRLRRKSR